MQEDQLTPHPPDHSGRRSRLPWILLGAVALLTLAAVLGLRGLAERPLAMPDWVTERVETRFNTALDGPQVAIGGIELTVGTSGLPRLLLREVSLFDARGVPVARLNQMGARLDRAKMVRGALQPRRLFFSGAEVTLRRRTDGTIDLSFGSGFEATGDPAKLLDDIEAAFAAPPLDGIRRISADDLTLILEDARSGRIWQITGGQLELTQDQAEIGLTVSAEVFNGTEDLAQAQFTVSLDRGTRAARLAARFENAAAVDIAAQSPALAFLEVLDAPISGTLESGIDDLGAFSSLFGSLEIGEGALTPDTDAPPIAFGGAELVFDYLPETHRIGIAEMRLETEALSVAGSGHAYLREFRSGWPGALVGQFRADRLTVAPEGLFEAPVTFDSAAVDMRLRLDPFTAQIGQLMLGKGDIRLLGSGRAAALADGWQTALDLSVNELDPDRLVDLWPVKFAPGTRDWLTTNLEAARLYDIEAAYRAEPGGEPRLSLSYKFRDALVRYMKTLPLIEKGTGYASILNDAYSMVLEDGHVTAPNGDLVDLAGTFLQIPDVAAVPSRALIALRSRSTIAGALSLLDLPPFELMKKAGRDPALAEGEARIDTALAFDLLKRIDVDDVEFRVEGTLSDVRSETLVTNRLLAADQLRLSADPEGLRISGPATLDGVALDATWTQAFGPDAAGQSRVAGTLDITPDALEAFNIALPPGAVAGQGSADFTLDLVRGTPPDLALQSDLAGLALRLDALGWRLPAAGTGRLEVAATLGQPADVPRLVLEAPGLSAEGQIRLGPDGQFAEARFDRVRAGDWFEGPVILRGRAGQSPAVQVAGGAVDLRRAPDTGAGEGGTGADTPIEIALDRLTISDGIALTGFSGSFRDRGGLDGEFTGQINGGTTIQGVVVPQGGRSAFRLRSADAGQAVADAGLLPNLRRGTMEVLLQPSGGEGTFEGSLSASGVRLYDAPAMTELLSAISVVGLLDQMSDGGIALDTIAARFRLSPEMLTLYEASAVGPALGLSLDGRYDLRSKRVDMQGVLSPIYFVNAIGRVVSTRRGEGLFGFNFTMTGDAKSPRVLVNPLSLLTPGIFRDIFRRPPPARVTP